MSKVSHIPHRFDNNVCRVELLTCWCLDDGLQPFNDCFIQPISIERSLNFKKENEWVHLWTLHKEENVKLFRVCSDPLLIIEAIEVDFLVVDYLDSFDSLGDWVFALG